MNNSIPIVRGGICAPITVQHQKESLGQAYVKAVVAKSGYNISASEHDYGVDGQIKDVGVRNGRHYETGFGIIFQLKSSVDVAFEDGFLVYDLESKIYNDLVIETGMLPFILVLFVMPRDDPLWLSVDQNQMIIRQCAWRCSLAGLEPTENEETKRIRIPIDHFFTADMVSSYETDIRLPSFEVMVRIADLFGLTVDYLLCREDKRFLEISALTNEEAVVVCSMVGVLRKRKSSS